MTISAAHDTSKDVEVRCAFGSADAAHFDRWRGALESALQAARVAGLVGRVTVVIFDATVRGLGLPTPAPGGADEWLIERRTPDGSPFPSTVMPETAPFMLMLAPKVDLGPSALGQMMATMTDPRVGLVEPRRIPFQSLKPFNPDTGEVSWAGADCCLVRSEVLATTGGFDAVTFPDLGADVDHSWRARLAGWSVRLAPNAAAYHHEPVPAGEAFLGAGSATTKLRLAARYAGLGVARAWAGAWRVNGRNDEREVAARFEADVAGGLMPDRISGDTAVFSTELFTIHPLAHTDPRGDALTMAAIRPPVRDAPERAGGLLLSVIVRTQGTRLAALEDNLLSLAAQSCADFEVLLMTHDLDTRQAAAVRAVVESCPTSLAGRVRIIEVSGPGRARPLNAGLQAASGTHVAFLDDDDVALASWVAEFHRVAGAHPDAVVWSQVAWQDGAEVLCAGQPVWTAKELPQLFVRQFDLLDHLRQNATPNCAIAVPIELVRKHGLHFREELAVFEDWDMILRLAQLALFAPTCSVTALYRRGSADGSGEVHGPGEWTRAGDLVLGTIDREGFVIRPEHLPRLRDALDQLESLEQHLGSRDRHEWSGAYQLIDGYFSGRKVAVISPHLDDAVLSCGDLISELDHPVVITAFAGDAVDWSVLRGWDEACGFSAGTNVVASRIREDDRALERLGAQGVRIQLLDEQYRGASQDPSEEDIGRALLDRVKDAGAEVVIMPLGLVHGDHRLTRQGAIWAARSLPSVEWFAYEDLPYAYEDGDIADALDDLAGFDPEPVLVPLLGQPGRKAAAIAQYESQLLGLGDQRRRLALRPERYWRLSVTAAPT